jgi:hypothetical protein
VGHVLLQELLALLVLGGFAQGDHPVVPGVHVARHPSDRATFPGGVASLKKDEHALFLLLEALLLLDEFCLGGPQLLVAAIPLDGSALCVFQSLILLDQSLALLE